MENVEINGKIEANERKEVKKKKRKINTESIKKWFGRRSDSSNNIHSIQII